MRGHFLRAAQKGDANALAYIAAVESADGQALEADVKTAINAFVVGCKTDGIWNAIKASCILAGARTLAGALVPLVGTAPTNFNFTSSDYNRKTGLKGDGSTKYLNLNRAPSSITNYLSNVHAAVHRVEAGGLGAGSLLATGNPGNALMIQWNGFWTLRALNGGGSVTGGDLLNLIGVSRSNSSSYTYRLNGTNGTISASSAANTENVFVFARNNGGVQQYSGSRIDFYSIGESIDLVLLDARVTTLMAAFAAAIP